MKRIFAATTCALALTFAAPAVAQDDGASTSAEVDKEIAAMSAMFGDIFGTADPLTAEQEARVPSAQSVVMKLFPEGTYAKMMNETLAPMFDQMFTSMGMTPGLMLVELPGLPPSAMAEVDEADLQSAIDLLDPNASERNSDIAKMTLDLITGIVVEIEPSYRAGLARAFAVRFSEDELADLDAYFATPVGSKYASESFLIYADPQVMSAMNEMMPKMMEAMPSMIGSIGEIAQKYPKGRTFSALSNEEQEKLAALLGATLEDLAASEPAPAPTIVPSTEAETEAEWVEEEGAS